MGKYRNFEFKGAVPQPTQTPTQRSINVVVTVNLSTAWQLYSTQGAHRVP